MKRGFSGQRCEVSVGICRVLSVERIVAEALVAEVKAFFICLLNSNTNSEQKFLKETDSRLATNNWKNCALSFFRLDVEIGETVDVLHPKLLKIIPFS